MLLPKESRINVRLRLIAMPRSPSSMANTCKVLSKQTSVESTVAVAMAPTLAEVVDQLGASYVILLSIVMSTIV